MNKLLFEMSDLQLWKRGDRYFVRYDAGAHQIVMREDEISEEEAHLAMKGGEETNKVLFAVQKRLIALGIDPYVSNVE